MWLLIIPILSNSVLPVSLPDHEVLLIQMSKEGITCKGFKQAHTCRVTHNVPGWSFESPCVTGLSLLCTLPEICKPRVTCNDEFSTNTSNDRVGQ